MEAAKSEDFKKVVNALEMVVPDGQPVRWAANLLHNTGMKERVYGPGLMVDLCERCEQKGISIYLFGSTEETCQLATTEMARRWPKLVVADIQPDRFRDATEEEDKADIARMNASGAGVVFVGRGCPRQERWVAAHRGKVTASMIAIGAAFDYLAGNLHQPPTWMQTFGLEWLWRLMLEPSRLWQRYLVTNSQYLYYLAKALLKKALSKN
jgi:N-acetylglucosaminyldiphosphoundecaprenol N-acetyl-beta-D-mannosaminyltransferase